MIPIDDHIGSKAPNQINQAVVVDCSGMAMARSTKNPETHIFRDQPYIPNSVPWILQSYFAMGYVYINYTLNTLWCILYNLY